MSDFCKKPSADERGGKMLEETLLDYSYLPLCYVVVWNNLASFATSATPSNNTVSPDMSITRLGESTLNRTNPVTAPSLRPAAPCRDGVATTRNFPAAVERSLLCQSVSSPLFRRPFLRLSLVVIIFCTLGRYARPAWSRLSKC